MSSGSISTPSSARRRKGLSSVGSPALVNLRNSNDDAQERRQRRKSKQLAAALASPASATGPREQLSTRTASEANERRLSIAASHTAEMSNAQLKEHYTNCIKLSSENKINAKNAFGLHLIDYMKDLVKNAQKDSDTANFQVASCTLDAGVKIYAGRVDSVHSDAYKMLGSLGRATDTQRDGADDEGGDNAARPAKEKRSRNTGKTIETNFKNINCDDFDLAFEVDPFFRKTTASFDEGGTGGLLLNNISSIGDSSELMLDSSVIPCSMPLSMGETSDEAESCDVGPLRDLLSSELYGKEICPQFSHFKFCGWDRTDLSTSFIGSGATDDNEHRYNLDASVTDMCGPQLNDTHGGYDGEDDDLGYDVGDGTMHSQPANHSVLTFRDGQSAVMTDSMTGMICSSGALCLQLSMEPSDYSYFKPHILDSWAGPQHWRNKNSTFGSSITSKRKGTKRPPFQLDYREEIDIVAPFKTTRAATTLSKATLDKYTKDQNLLPDDIHYDIDNLFRLTIQPMVKVMRQQNAIRFSESNDACYNYDNPNDRENFCPNMDNNDTSYDDGGMGICDSPMGNDMTFQDDGMGINHTMSMANTFAGGNLVQEPNKVRRIEINYAKSAKIIDIKKLKRCMWNVICTSEEVENKENHAHQSLENDKQIIEDQVVAGQQSFSSLYTMLPETVSSNMAKNLSVPIAFVCLLYLANEKDLKLTAGNKLDDFDISQGASS